MIKINNLVYNYKSRELYNGLTFEFNEGEIYVLTGSNGSGKSTLFRLITENTNNGIKHSYENEKFVHTFSTLYLYEKLTVKENLYYFKSFFKAKNEELEDLIKFFEIEPILDVKVSELSTGNKKIVDIIKSFLNSNAKVYLLDEPLVNLDSDKIMLLLNYLEKKKRTSLIIIATHNKESFKNIYDNELNLGNSC